MPWNESSLITDRNSVSARFSSVLPTKTFERSRAKPPALLTNLKTERYRSHRKTRPFFFRSKKHGRQDRVGFVPTSVPSRPSMEWTRSKSGVLVRSASAMGTLRAHSPVIQDMREAVDSCRPAFERKIPEPFQNHFMIDVGRSGDLEST